MAFNMQAILAFSGKGIKETSSQVEGVMKKVGKLGKETSESLTNAAETLGKAAIPALAVGAGFAFAVHKAIEWDSAMQAIQAQTGATNEVLAQLGFSARRAALNTGQSAQDAAQSLLIMSKAGLTAAESMSVLETALSAADATGVSVVESTKAISTGLIALTSSFPAAMSNVDRFNKLSDMMVFAVNKAGASMNGLEDAIQTGGMSLSKMGVPLQQIVASFSMLEKAGIGGGQGAQQLAMMMQQLAEPSELANKELAKLGISTKKLDLKDLSGTVSLLNRAFSSIKDPIKRSRLEAELFGTRGMKVFNALSRGGSDAMMELSKNIENSQGATKKFEDIRTNTFKEQIERLSSAAGQLVTEISLIFTENKDSVLPFLKDVVVLVQDLGKAFLFAAGDTEAFGKNIEDLSPGQKEMIEFAKGFREGLQDMFKTAKTVFVSIKGFLSDVATESGLNTKQIGSMIAKFLAVAAIAGPILVTIAGLVGSIGWVIGGLSTTISALGTAFSVAGSVISFVLSGLGVAFTVLSTIGGWVMTGLATAIAFLSTPIGIVVGVIAALTAAVALLVGGFMNVVKSWDTIKAEFKNGFMPGMLALFKAFGEGMLNVLLWPIEKVKQGFKSIAGFFGFGDDKNVNVKVKNPASDVVKAVDDSSRKQNATATQISRQQDMSNMVQEESINNKRLISPLSAAQPTAQAISSSLPTPIAQGPAGGGDKTINTSISVNLDGREIARAVARNQIENGERSGQTLNPGQKRSMLERGSQAVGGGR